MEYTGGGPSTDAMTEGWSSSSSVGTTDGTSSAPLNITTYFTTAANTLGLSSEASTYTHNATLHDDPETTVGDLVTKASDVIIKASTTFKPYYEYSTAQFEVLLPCIFGMFVILALSFIVFYSKHTNQYEVLEKRSGDKPNKADNSATQDWSMSNGMGEMNGAFSFGS